MLLEVGHRRQVSRQLDDTRRAAPVGAESAGVDRRYEASPGGGVITGEGIAIAFREIGVRVAQIQGEDLVGEAYTDIPRVIAGFRNTIWERSAKSGAHSGPIKRIGCSEPLTAELAGDIHAKAAGAERRAGRGPLARDRRVVAPGAEVQEVWRIILVEADLKLIIEGDVDLGIPFIKARTLFGEVAIDRQTPCWFAEICIAAENRAIALERSSLRTEALSTWINVAPQTEVEGKHADGRADTAVDVDLSGGTVRE